MWRFYFEQAIAIAFSTVLLVGIDALLLKYAAYLVAKLRIAYILAVKFVLVPVVCFNLLVRWLPNGVDHIWRHGIALAVMFFASWVIFGEKMKDSQGNAIPPFAAFLIVVLNLWLLLVIAMVFAAIFPWGLR
jgi:hypothetical protein